MYQNSLLQPVGIRNLFANSIYKKGQFGIPLFVSEVFELNLISKKLVYQKLSMDHINAF